MGGFIAQHLALRHPERVGRLVLVGTAAGIRGEIPAPLREEWIEDPVERARKRLPYTCAPGYFERHPERLELLAAETRVNRMTFEGYARQSTAIAETHDVRARLGDIRQPALVIHGDQDGLVPLALGEELATGIPDARLVVLPGVGHLPHREVPDRFAELVHDFLRME